MAQKQIKGNEIIENDHLANAKESALGLLKVYNELDEQIKKTAQSSKKMVQGADTGTIKGIKQLNEQLEKSTKLRSAQTENEKKSQEIKKKLIALDEQEIKSKVRFQEANRELNATIRDQIKLEKTQAGSIARLRAENKKLEKEKINLDLTNKKQVERLKEINRQLDVNNIKIKSNQDALSKQRLEVGGYTKALNKSIIGIGSFASALGLMGGLQIVASLFKDAFTSITDFNQAIADLSAITGASGGDLDKFKNEVRNVARQTRTSAIEMAKAFQIVGSAQPELLKSAEALGEVTKQAVLLSQAGGLSLEDSAQSLTLVMNQFQASSEKAGMFADILATSQQKGTATILQQAEAMKNVGSVANTVGLSFESTSASLQALAKGGLVGAEAGTKLRGVLLKLAQTGRDDLNPELHSMFDIMSTLEGEINGVADAQKLFGAENAAAALTLIAQKDVIDELDGSLNVVGSAQEQANTRMGTMSGAVEQLKNRWEDFILGLEDGTGAMSGVINWVLELANGFISLISGTGEVTDALMSIPTFRIIKEVKDLYEQVQKAFNSFEDFGKTLFKVGKIMANVLTLGFFRKEIDGMEKSIFTQKKYTAEQERKLKVQAKSLEMGKELLKDSAKEISNASILIDSLKQENITREDKQKAINKLQEMYPDLLGNIDLETAGIDTLIQAKKQLIAQILEEGIQRKQAEVMAKITEDILKTELAMITSGSDALKQKQKENLYALQQVEIVANKVRENIGGIVDGMDLSANYRGMGDEIRMIEGKLSILRTQLAKAQTEEQKKVVNESIDYWTKQLERKKRVMNTAFNNALGVEDGTKKIEAEVSVKGSGSGSKGKITIEDVFDEPMQKILLGDRNITGIGAVDPQTQLSTEREEPAWLIAYREALQKQIDADAEAKQKIVEANKQMANDLMQLYETMATNLASKLDEQIQNSLDRIADSESKINDLKAQANSGNLDAKESIKLEQQRIANEKAQIEQLEKKKRNLLILTTGLQLANTKIQAGDGNGLANATSQMQNFIQGLQGFYDGTEMTLGEEVSDAYKIKGDKDTHIIKAHKDEKIIGVENSRKLKGMSQTDIVTGALLYKNQELLNNRVVTRYNHATAMNDERIVNELRATRNAIESLDFPEYDWKFSEVDGMFKEWVKRRGRVDTNTNKLGGCFK